MTFDGIPARGAIEMPRNFEPPVLRHSEFVGFEVDEISRVIERPSRDLPRSRDAPVVAGVLLLDGARGVAVLRARDFIRGVGDEMTPVLLVFEDSVFRLVVVVETLFDVDEAKVLRFADAVLEERGPLMLPATEELSEPPSLVPSPPPPPFVHVLILARRESSGIIAHGSS